MSANILNCTEGYVYVLIFNSYHIFELRIIEKLGLICKWTVLSWSERAKRALSLFVFVAKSFIWHWQSGLHNIRDSTQQKRYIHL